MDNDKLTNLTIRVRDWEVRWSTNLLKKRSTNLRDKGPKE